jgi:hypothetical protein
MVMTTIEAGAARIVRDSNAGAAPSRPRIAKL